METTWNYISIYMCTVYVSRFSLQFWSQGALRCQLRTFPQIRTFRRMSEWEMQPAIIGKPRCTEPFSGWNSTSSTRFSGHTFSVSTVEKKLLEFRCQETTAWDLDTKGPLTFKAQVGSWPIAKVASQDQPTMPNSHAPANTPRGHALSGVNVRVKSLRPGAIDANRTRALEHPTNDDSLLVTCRPLSIPPPNFCQNLGTPSWFVVLGEKITARCKVFWDLMEQQSALKATKSWGIVQARLQNTSDLSLVGTPIAVSHHTLKGLQDAYFKVQQWTFFGQMLLSPMYSLHSSPSQPSPTVMQFQSLQWSVWTWQLQSRRLP